MKTWTGIIAATAIATAAGSASGVLYMSEVFTNPPGSFDDTHEFIELRGTPGKKLDGFAVAAISGGLNLVLPAGFDRGSG